MTERQRTTEILKALRLHGAWCFKVHGGPTQEAGIPDILGFYEGRGFAFEVKLPDRYATPVQEMQLKRIRAAGAVAEVVRSPTEALAALGITARSPARSTASS